tara:strand:- start:4900 stop:5676 length:777 start_codon:yes stop_codon:yes gene_type:complete
MSKSIISIIEDNENLIQEKNEKLTISSKNLTSNSRESLGDISSELILLNEEKKEYELTENLKKELLTMFENYLETEPSLDLANLAQMLFLTKDVREGEAEYKIWENLAPGDILKLSSPENESLLVLVNNTVNESGVVECFPVALDTFIATQSSIILEPKDSTLETDLAILLDYKFLVNKNHIDSYVGRCYSQSNIQGLPKTKRNGYPLKGTQDRRDIERARLARIINYYAQTDGFQEKEKYMLDKVINLGKQRLNLNE